MKKMFGKNKKLLIASLISIALLNGCSETPEIEDDKIPSDTYTQIGQVAAPNQNVEFETEIIVMDTSILLPIEETDNVLADLADRFMKLNPEIKINILSVPYAESLDYLSETYEKLKDLADAQENTDDSLNTQEDETSSENEEESEPPIMPNIVIDSEQKLKNLNESELIVPWENDQLSEYSQNIDQLLKSAVSLGKAKYEIETEEPESNDNSDADSDDDADSDTDASSDDDADSDADSDTSQEPQYTEKQYMLPISAAPYFLAFNLDILKEYGVDNLLPYQGDRNWTPDQYRTLMEALAEKLPEEIVSGEYSSANSTFNKATRNFVSNLYGSKVSSTVDGSIKYSLNDESAIKGADFVSSLVKDKLIRNSANLSPQEVLDNFYNDASAHTIMFSVPLYIQFEGKTSSGKEIILMPYPSEQSTKNADTDITGVAVLKTNDEKATEAAQKFAIFLSTDSKASEYLSLATAGVSTNKKASNLYTDENLKFAEKTFSTISIPPSLPSNDAMFLHWVNAFKNIINQKEDSESILNTFVEKSNETLE